MAVEGWGKTNLGAVAKLEKGISYSAENYCDEGNGLPFITIKCFSKGGGYSPRGIKFYDGPYKDSQRVVSGDLIIANTDLTRAGDIIGSPIIIPSQFESDGALISMDLSKLFIDNTKANQKFVYYKLLSSEVRAYMKSISSGSTVLHLQTKSVPKIHIDLPPLHEQKKIAEILESVDDAIAKTESVIAQTQRVKQGLLQQLLTRGIGHTKFEQSLLGEIPESWEVKTLADTGKWSGGGTPSKQNPNFWVGSIPWVSPKDMKAKVITETEDYISNEAIQGSATSLLPKGTILIVTRSGILRHTLPIAIAGVDLAVNQDLKTIQVCGPFLRKFVFYWLQSNSEKILKECSKEGTTVESIETDTFKKFLIPLPSKGEQEKIISIIDSLQDFDEAEVQKLKFLRIIKSGLISDLLTGRVRVNVDAKTLNKIEEAA